MDNSLKEEVDYYLKIHLGKYAEDCQVLIDPLASLSAYHISNNPNIKAFHPFVTDRTLPKETRNIPRTSCSPSWMGCLLGTNFFGDFREASAIKQYIYQIDSNRYVRPTEALLQDVWMTDELWVVYTRPEHLANKPAKIGEFFLGARSESMVNGDFHRICTYYLKLTQSHFTVMQNSQFSLSLKEPGYYQVVIRVKQPDIRTLAPEDIDIIQLKEQDYLKTLVRTRGLRTK